MPLVSNQICARICARDAAGWGATRETPRFGVDARHPLAKVSAATRDRPGRGRRTSYAHNPATLASSFGFDVVLGGGLEDPRWGSDLGFGWLQDRIPVRCPPSGKALAEAGQVWVLAWFHQPKALVHFLAERSVLRGKVADPGGRLGEVAVGDGVQLLMFGVGDGSWFGGAQGLDLLVWVTTT